MKIVIFGLQGSGKGTQAELIARRHGLAYISTGDIFRFHYKSQTDLGKKVCEYINRGHLVPDEMTNEMVKYRLEQPDCEKGFVLDGYPRNRLQLDYLKKLIKIDLAIAIDLSDEEAVKRLANRLACKCGMSYHTIFNPPQKTGRCDKCGGELFRRDDDQPQAIKQRLEIFHQQTVPLFEEYQKLGVLYRVDGSKSIEEVYKSIEEIITRHN